MSDEWGPWIEHDGKGCPCVGQYVETRLNLRAGYVMPGCPSSLVDGGMGTVGIATGGVSWYWAAGFARVIRYRIRRPRALQTLIEIAANPAPLPEEVEA
jgi:hypothetical protein